MKGFMRMLNVQQIRTMNACLSLNSLLDFKDMIRHMSHDPEACIEYYNPKNTKERYLYIKTHPDSKVLAVAHTDYVLYRTPHISYDKRYVKCPQLDDRLGVWLILDYLKNIVQEKAPFDILLTDFEEKGNSTAQHFNTDEGKTYNWMFQFDRRGTDVVMYEYETPELKKIIENYGFEVGRGSFTDLCYLSQLNCAGFNIGTGYHGEHSTSCYADLRETFGNAEKFLHFYMENYNVKFNHDHEAAKRKKNDKLGWRNSGYIRNNYGYNAHNPYSTYYNSQHNNTQKSKKKGKGQKYNPFSRLNIGKDEASQKFLEAIKDQSMKKKLLKIADMTFIEMDEEEFDLYTQYIKPLIHKKTKDTDQDLLVSDALSEEILKAKQKLVSKEWTDQEYDAWLAKVLKREYGNENDNLFPTTEEINKEGEENEFSETSEKWAAYKSLYEEYKLDSVSVDTTFREWCEETFRYCLEYSFTEPHVYWEELLEKIETTQILSKDVMEQIRWEVEDEYEDVKDATDTELEELIQDPLYSSEDFPGGKEARKQTLTDLT